MNIKTWFKVLFLSIFLSFINPLNGLYFIKDESPAPESILKEIKEYKEKYNKRINLDNSLNELELKAANALSISDLTFYYLQTLGEKALKINLEEFKYDIKEYAQAAKKIALYSLPKDSQYKGIKDKICKEADLILEELEKTYID